MNPRRLHSDTIFSICKFSFGSGIGPISVCEAGAGVNQIFTGLEPMAPDFIGLTRGKWRGLF
jgi:hypothetical protein